MIILVICCTIISLIVIGIVGLLFFQSFKFFMDIPVMNFLGGKIWDPPSSVHSYEDTMLFGLLPLLSGTLLITLIAMITAIPISMSIATYLSFFAQGKIKVFLKTAVEVLAGIPSIVYGFFALYLIAPMLYKLFAYFGITITSESAINAGFVLGIMVVPYIASIADDAFSAVPKQLIDQSLALGSTKFEMITRVCTPSAIPGLLSAIIMGFSRAIGETMLVVMASGMTANLSFKPLSSVTTITVQIVSIMTGDQEFDSPKTLSAFALGLILFLITLILNSFTIRFSRWYTQRI